MLAVVEEGKVAGTVELHSRFSYSVRGRYCTHQKRVTAAQVITYQCKLNLSFNCNNIIKLITFY
jgi:hypothetical protein